MSTATEAPSLRSPAEDPDAWYTVETARRKLGCSPQVVRRLAAEKTVTSWRVRAGWLYLLASDVDTLAASAISRPEN